MSLVDQVSALATRLATEFNSVRTALAGKAPTSHAHAVITLPEQGSIPTATPDAESLFAVDVNGITSVRLVSPTGLVTDVQRDNSIIVRNETGSTIAKGAPVYIAGVSTSAYGLPATYLPLVALARANSLTTMPAVGLAVQAIPTGGSGRVLRHGMLTGVDTSTYTVGQRLWVATSAAGTLTNTEPVDRVQRIGIVARAHATEGQILVDPRVMLAISEGSLTPSGGASGTVLAKNSATNWDTVWKALTAADVGAATSGHTHSYDPTGTAAAAVAAHEAAGDPHPQYLTAAEGNAAYRALNPAPRAQSITTGTANVDVGAAGDVQVTLGTVTATTLTPTNGVNGRACVVEVLAASGATRTPTWASSVKLTDGIASLGLAIPTGRVGVFVIRCSTITGSTVYELASSYLRAA